MPKQILLNQSTRHRSFQHLAIALFAADFVLVAAYVVGTFVAVPNAQIYHLINLDAEASLGAWFSSSQLLVTSLVFAVAAYNGGRRSAQFGFLCICALAFLFLSADESASIHEKITMLTRGVNYLPRFNGNHGAWIPIYLGLAIVFLLLTWKTWLQSWQSQRRELAIFLLGIGLFVAGAVLLEIVSYGALRDLENRSYYAYQVLFEEALELAGVTFILLGALSICARQQELA